MNINNKKTHGKVIEIRSDGLVLDIKQKFHGYISKKELDKFNIDISTFALNEEVDGFPQKGRTNGYKYLMLQMSENEKSSLLNRGEMLKLRNEISAMQEDESLSNTEKEKIFSKFRQLIALCNNDGNYGLARNYYREAFEYLTSITIEIIQQEIENNKNADVNRIKNFFEINSRTIDAAGFSVSTEYDCLYPDEFWKFVEQNSALETCMPKTLDYDKRYLLKSHYQVADYILKNCDADDDNEKTYSLCEYAVALLEAVLRGYYRLDMLDRDADAVVDYLNAAYDYTWGTRNGSYCVYILPSVHICAALDICNCFTRKEQRMIISPVVAEVGVKAAQEMPLEDLGDIKFHGGITSDTAIQFYSTCYKSAIQAYVFLIENVSINYSKKIIDTCAEAICLFRRLSCEIDNNNHNGQIVDISKRREIKDNIACFKETLNKFAGSSLS